MSAASLLWVLLVASVFSGSVTAQQNDVDVSALLARMSVDQKIAQLIQAERNDASADDVANYCLGSVFSGGGSYPGKSTVNDWFQMTQKFAAAAMQCPLKIPLLYGVDAVHGHSNVQGATIFPHNIGLGASRSGQAVADGAYVTSREMAATGVNFAFAPCVAVARDPRWGRTYESFGEQPEVATRLAAPYVQGMYNASHRASATLFPIVGSVKHFIGDGATKFGSGPNTWLGVTRYMIDQGDAQISEEELRRIHLPGFIEAVRAGIQTVMISYSSVNGDKMHAQRHLITDVLKNEVGFQGFTISDYNGAQFMPGSNYAAKIADSVNAGVDMHMVTDFKWFFYSAKEAVAQGWIPMSRLDDAVTRILRVKKNMGLFEQPVPPRDVALQAAVGGPAHRRLARRAVQKTLVLLKNENHVLPLSRSSPLVVTGSNADDVGAQCGGWTLSWQGGRGRSMSGGTSILDGLKSYASAGISTYDYSFLHHAPAMKHPNEVAVIVMGEYSPYAEGVGDRQADQLTLAEASRPSIFSYATDSKALLDLAARAPERPIVCVVVSGRALVMTEQELNACTALVAAWLPGSEGAGVADVLYGTVNFRGRLPVTWPRDTSQIPFVGREQEQLVPAFPFGFGLSYGSAAPIGDDTPYNANANVNDAFNANWPDPVNANANSPNPLNANARGPFNGNAANPLNGNARGPVNGNARNSANTNSANAVADPSTPVVDTTVPDPVSSGYVPGPNSANSFNSASFSSPAPRPTNAVPAQ